MRGPKLGFRTSLLVLLSIGVMMFDHRTLYLVKARSFLSDFVSPLQQVINWPVDIINWVDGSVTTHKQLLVENASLRVQQVLLNARLEKLMSLQKENDQLRSLLASSPKINTHKVMIAQVLAVATAPYIKQVVLNQGSGAGVFVGQAVIDATGVVGQVVKVSHFTSRVMLLTDLQSSIPIEDVRTNMRGVLSGTTSYDELQLLHIPNTADIKVGDQLVSSGLGLRYPIGYPVGIIRKVTRDPSEPFMDIVVTPTAQLSKTRLVLLLWPQQQKVIASARQQLTTIKALQAKAQHSITGDA